METSTRTSAAIQLAKYVKAMPRVGSCCLRREAPDRWDNGQVTDESWMDQSAIDDLRQPFDGLCWWCRQRPADSGEHKFKMTDLTRMWNDDGLVWVGDNGSASRHIKGKSALKRDRYGVLKFPKSLCKICNNSASQPFDDAYAKYSADAAAPYRSRRKKIDLQRLYGPSWQRPASDLGRYFVKHFGCRMVAGGIPVPTSMRAFLDGAPDMRDVHLGLLTTREVNSKPQALGLSTSIGVAFADQDRTRLVGMVSASYVGKLGVRFEWREGGFDSSWQSFFHFNHAVINRFNTEFDVVYGRRRRGLLERTLR